MSQVMQIKLLKENPVMPRRTLNKNLPIVFILVGFVPMWFKNLEKTSAPTKVR